MSRSRMGMWMVLAVLVVGALTVGIVVVRDGGGDAANASEPVPLRLSTAGGAPTTAPVGADLARPIRPTTYVAGADLPALGGTAPVYSLTAPDDTAVGRLARALGISATVAHVGTGRVASDGTRQLSVYGTSWSMDSIGSAVVGSGTVTGTPAGAGSGDASTPNSGAGSTATTIVDTTIPGASTTATMPCTTVVPPIPCPSGPPPTAAPLPTLPSEGEATTRALAVLEAAGFDTTSAVTTADNAVTAWSVTVGLRAGGHTVSGFGATFDIGPGGEIEFAGGAAGTVSSLGDYPLVDTSEAIDRLNAEGPFSGGGVEPMTAVAQDIAAAGGAPIDPATGAPITTVPASASTPPAGEPTSTAPVDAAPPATAPPATAPPATAPPATAPPATAPPATAPPATAPPATAPPATAPPATAPPATAPPATSPPDTSPPDSFPPLTATLERATIDYAIAASWDGVTNYVVPTYRFVGTDSDGGAVNVTALAVDDSLLKGPDDSGSGAPGDKCAAVESGGGTTITVYAPECDPTATVVPLEPGAVGGSAPGGGETTTSTG